MADGGADGGGEGKAMARMLRRRSFRVVALVVAIAAMSAADLYLTLLYVTHTGMNEMNPLARAIMAYQSPGVLAAWKGGTVLICAGILLVIRKQQSAEIGAWAGCLVLGWLMSHWVVFINETSEMNIEIAQAISESDPTWVMIGSGPIAPGQGRTVID